MLPYSIHSRSIQAPARRIYLFVLLLSGVGTLFHSPYVSAQIAPSTTEVARYTGLHAAAHRGDVSFIQAKPHSKDALNATDSYGRTPLHVATFAKQRDAIRALVKAGADLNKLENDRYDAVTIASVADDEETLRVLLQLGASAKLTTSRWDGTALIAARAFGPRWRGTSAYPSWSTAGSCEQPALDSRHRSRRFGQRRCTPPSQPESLDRRRCQPETDRSPRPNPAATRPYARIQRDGSHAGKG